METKEINAWVEELFLKVDDLFSKGEFFEGKKILEELLEQEPGYGRAHNHLGWLYYAKFDEFEKAENHFKLAIKFAALYPAGYMNLTYLLNYLNRHEELVRHIDKSLKIEGTVKSTLYTELGKSYEINGKYKEATESYRSAIRFSLNKEEMASLNENLDRVKTKTGLFEKKYFFF